MVLRRLFVLCACAAPLLVTACATTKAAEPPSGKTEEQVMMEKWMAFMTPGPEHKVLDTKVGHWNLVVRMWQDPSAPPTESTATSDIKWVMGGRYIQEECRGSFMEQPFEGMGFAGFDNMKQKYFGTWIDNMGTGFMMSEGTYDPARKAILYKGKGPDVMVGEYVPVRSVDTFVDANTMKAEMFSAWKDGKEYKMMEINYTRAY